MGSPGFIAPEALAEKPYDHRADVFSYGMLCYEVTTGNFPFYLEVAEVDDIKALEVCTLHPHTSLTCSMPCPQSYILPSPTSPSTPSYSPFPHAVAACQRHDE